MWWKMFAKYFLHIKNLDADKIDTKEAEVIKKEQEQLRKRLSTLEWLADNKFPSRETK